MTTSFNTMVTNISLELNMGTTYDAYLPRALRNAIRGFERKLDFPYMRNQVGVGLSEGDTTADLNDLVEVDMNQFKTIKWWRLEDDNGNFTYMNKVDPRDFASVDSSAIPPTSYWIDLQEELVYFDREVNDDYSTTRSIAMVVESTDPDTLVAGLASHWLFDNAEEALIAATVMNMSPRMREPEFLMLYKTQFDDAWDDLVQHVEDFDTENTDLKMNPFRNFGAT